jgi:hypothetical protein
MSTIRKGSHLLVIVLQKKDPLPYIMHSSKVYKVSRNRRERERIVYLGTWTDVMLQHRSFSSYRDDIYSYAEATERSRMDSEVSDPRSLFSCSFPAPTPPAPLIPALHRRCYIVISLSLENCITSNFPVNTIARRLEKNGAERRGTAAPTNCGRVQSNRLLSTSSIYQTCRAIDYVAWI